MDKFCFETFPSNQNEALSMLYLQNQDLSGESPEEINSMYWDAYYRIKRDDYIKSQANYFTTCMQNIVQETDQP